MAHQKPVIFGPAFHKFPEAVALVKEKAGISVRNIDEMVEAVTFFSDSANRTKAGSAAYDYLVRHQGASDKVVQYIMDIIPSTQSV